MRKSKALKPGEKRAASCLPCPTPSSRSVPGIKCARTRMGGGGGVGVCVCWFGVLLRSAVVFLQVFGMFEERLGEGRLKGVAT